MNKCTQWADGTSKLCVSQPLGTLLWDLFYFWSLAPKKYHFLHILHQIWFSEGVHLINFFHCNLTTVLVNNKCPNENSIKKQLKHQKTPYGSALWWWKSIISINFNISGSMHIHPQSFIKIGELWFFVKMCTFWFVDTSRTS